ncbi:MAG: HAD-IA family hydrolase [Planctomycetia bacterium]|nr:HAD-IA family hydrolase [Planctomycetia bacterium]
MLKMMGWDMDGTMCDTVPMCVEAFRRAMMPYWKKRLSDEEIFSLFGLSETGLVKMVVGEAWEKADEDFHRHYEALLEDGVALFPGILEIFQLLEQNGIRKVLITGKGRRSCDMTLRKLGLTEAFEEICVGTEERLNKGEHITTLLKKYHLQPEEFCYVGDAVSDVAACREAGVLSLSAAWAPGADTEGLRRVNPNHVLENVADLENQIQIMING